MELPAVVRKQFGHSAVNFYSAIEQNPKEMYDKGFISESLANSLGVTTRFVDDRVQVNKPSESTPTEPTPTEPTPTVSENVSAD